MLILLAIDFYVPSNEDRNRCK